MPLTVLVDREDRIAISHAGDVGLVVLEADINALLSRIAERAAYFAASAPEVPRKTASDCGQTRKRSLSRRRRSLCGKDPGKVLAIVEEQHKPEHLHDQRAPPMPS
jgi:hypothetical protein